MQSGDRFKLADMFSLIVERSHSKTETTHQGGKKIKSGNGKMREKESLTMVLAVRVF